MHNVSPLISRCKTLTSTNSEILPNHRVFEHKKEAGLKDQPRGAEGEI